MASLWYAQAYPRLKRVVPTDLIAGEVDIVEYPNLATKNLMALHTKEGCSVAGSDQTGEHVMSVMSSQSPS